MPKELPVIGSTVYVDFGSPGFEDFSLCEVVQHIDKETIEVEHQVSDGLETTETTSWITKIIPYYP